MKRLLNFYRVNAKRGSFQAEANTIYIYDMIVGSDLEAAIFGGISPQSFAETLAGMSGPVSLRINSPGGDVFGARAMSQAMREYKGEITAQVDGYAASAASLIAVAADKCVMAPGSLMMIHKAWSLQIGNADDMLATAELLEKIDGTLAGTYAAKSGGDPAKFADMMAKETWFTPQEAKDAGLCDEIIEENQEKSGESDDVANLGKWDISAFEGAPKPAANAFAALNERKEANRVAAEQAAKAEAEREQIERRQRELAVRLLQTA